MKKINYTLTENIIEDTCIVNGICKILKDNFIEFTLEKKPHCYQISYDETQIDEELIFVPLKKEDFYSVNSTYYTELYKGNPCQVDILNQYFNDNINNILDDICNYYKIYDYKAKGISIGNHFYSMSFQSGRVQQSKTSFLKRYLSFLGFVTSCSIIKNDKAEINFLMLPKENKKINNIIKPDYKVKNKEGEIFTLTKFNTSEKRSDIEMSALLFLKNIQYYYKEKNNYTSMMTMQYALAGNKPMSDKYYEIDILNFSIELYLKLENIIKFNKNYDVKEMVSKFVLNSSYKNYSKMIEVLSKNDDKLNINFIKEIISMYDNNIQNITFNESIIKIGKGLNSLLYKNKGYEILAELYNVANEKKIFKLVNRIIDDYKRYYKFSLLNEKEYQDLVTLIQGKQNSKIIANAILGYSRVFFESKKIDNSTDNNENNKNNESEEI